MAFEGVQIALPGVISAADISTKQFYCFKKNATDLEYILCDTDGEVFDAVLQNKPSAADRAASLAMFGVTKVITGEALTAGDLWGTDSAGKAKIIESSNTGADVGDYVMGRVIVGAASGALATVTIGVPSYKVESA